MAAVNDVDRTILCVEELRQADGRHPRVETARRLVGGSIGLDVEPHGLAGQLLDIFNGRLRIGQDYRGAGGLRFRLTITNQVGILVASSRVGHSPAPTCLARQGGFQIGMWLETAMIEQTPTKPRFFLRSSETVR